MAQGTIKTLVTERGFGFIESEGKEVFFHGSALQEAKFDDLREGQQVEFSIGQGPKGPRAENLKLVT